jgi:hypothetical protein
MPGRAHVPARTRQHPRWRARLWLFPRGLRCWRKPLLYSRFLNPRLPALLQIPFSHPHRFPPRRSVRVKAATRRNRRCTSRSAPSPHRSHLPPRRRPPPSRHAALPNLPLRRPWSLRMPRSWTWHFRPLCLSPRRLLRSRPRYPWRPHPAPPQTRAVAASNALAQGASNTAGRRKRRASTSIAPAAPARRASTTGKVSRSSCRPRRRRILVRSYLPTGWTRCSLPFARRRHANPRLKVPPRCFLSFLRIVARRGFSLNEPMKHVLFHCTVSLGVLAFHSSCVHFTWVSASVCGFSIHVRINVTSSETSAECMIVVRELTCQMQMRRRPKAFHRMSRVCATLNRRPISERNIKTDINSTRMPKMTVHNDHSKRVKECVH